jgi:hypothetical protein
MAIVPLCRDEVVHELESVALAAHGGAILINPAGSIVLASRDVTLEAADIARTQSPRLPSRVGDSASFTADDGTWVHVLGVCNGWVLAVQTVVDIEELQALLGRTRNNLALWLGYTQLPTGNSAPPASGAPAQVFAIRPHKPGRG